MADAQDLNDQAVLATAGPPGAAATAIEPERSALKLITLHLARCPGYPEGSARHGYAMVAPLDREGHLDPAGWHRERERCFVRRFWGEERDRVGHLVHRRGGAGGATWCFAFADARGQDDEPGFHLESHHLAPGEYISIREEDGDIATFKVIEVGKACAR